MVHLERVRLLIVRRALQRVERPFPLRHRALDDRARLLRHPRALGVGVPRLPPRLLERRLQIARPRDDPRERRRVLRLGALARARVLPIALPEPRPRRA